jgi:MerR family transcriptional regulator, light-induced transcriptional regulator
MNDRSSQTPIALNIASVERDTGLSKDTLRVWERRYGFPMPQRDSMGERAYSLDQVDKLRLLKRLLDLGHRPGKVVTLPIEQLQALAASAGGGAARSMARMEVQDDLERFITRVKSHDVEALRTDLSQMLLRKGLGAFVTDTIAHLNEMIGEAWTRGTIEVYEEHIYTEVAQSILRQAIGGMPRSGERPAVLLTTFPQEAHGLGLLMAEAMFVLEGCRCVSLGVQTPLWDIVQAADANRSDIVALSFSSSLNPNHVLDGLTELRAKLPAAQQIWAGGSCPVLHRRPPSGIRTFRRLEDIGAAVQIWRAEHGR